MSVHRSNSGRYASQLSRVRRLVLLLSVHLLITATLSAHEGIGRAGFSDPLRVEVQSDFYVGRRGYLHGGLGAVIPLNEKQKIGFIGHFVREETGGAIYPSLAAEFVQDLCNGFDLEAYSFGYFPVEKQHAWAARLPPIYSERASHDRAILWAGVCTGPRD